jgi:DNA-binding GntR family transcriptional regulator
VARALRRPIEEVQLDPLPRGTTVKDTVYDSLLKAILGGVVGKDVAITEAGLAEKLRVSRTPVREALRDLERDGILEPVGVNGKRVRRISVAEARELYWLRRVLEGEIVARVAAAKPSSDLMQRIDDLLERQRSAARTRRRGEFLEADSEFHVTLARMTGFNKVTEIMANIRLNLALLGHTAVVTPGRMEAVMEEHERVRAALRDGDPGRARAAMHDHLNKTEAIVIEVLERGGGAV